MEMFRGPDLSPTPPQFWLLFASLSILAPPRHFHFSQVLFRTTLFANTHFGVCFLLFREAVRFLYLFPGPFTLRRATVAGARVAIFFMATVRVSSCPFPNWSPLNSSPVVSRAFIGTCSCPKNLIQKHVVPQANTHPTSPLRGSSPVFEGGAVFPFCFFFF